MDARTGRCRRDGGRRLGLAALAIYAGLSLAFFGWPIVGRFSRAYVGSGIDPTLAMWALVWWPYALRHGLNPFYTDRLWAPQGASLAWLTGVPGASVAAAPLTLTAGPVAAYNVLVLLAPALAAWAAYLVCRRVTGRFWPAVLGGYAFGFSAYEMGHLLGHLNLMQTFLIPLAVYLVLLLLDRAVGPATFVLLLGAVLWMQFLLSNEIFATMTIFGAVALGWALLFSPRERRPRLRAAALLIAGAYVVAIAGLAPYLYAIFAGGIPRNSLTDPRIYSTDLLNFFTPTALAAIGGAALAPVSQTFPGNTAEQSAYLGVPLLVVIAAFARGSWRRPEAKVLLCTAGTAALASLGPTLHAAGRSLLPLPWTFVTPLPVLNNALPGRFSLYVAFLAAIILALWLSPPTGGARREQWALGVLAVVCLLPNLRAPGWATAADPPAFITDTLYRAYLDKDDAVLVIPYGANGDCMLWQAETGMYFRMAEGVGTGSISRDFFRWPINYTFYSGRLIPDYAAQLKAYLGAHGIQKIVVADGTPGPWGTLFGALGAAPVHVGGVSVYRVPETVRSASRSLTPVELERRSTLALAASLIAAGDYYLAHAIPLAGLTPLDAEQRGLLPSYWGGYTASDANGTPGLVFSTRTGLRLGPWGRETVGVGLRASARGIGPLVARYAPLAERIYFPYPRPIAGAPFGDGVVLMIFTQEGLRRAAATSR